MLVELLNLFGLVDPATTVIEFVIVVFAAGFIGEKVGALLSKK